MKLNAKKLGDYTEVRKLEGGKGDLQTARQLQATAPPEAKVTAPSRPTLLEARGLLLDLQQETATRRGEVLSLTPTEFHMLVYLTERLDQVVGYQELATAIHGAESGEWESWEARQTLATHMWRLRRKLGDGPAGHPYIVNVRGRGYRFIRHP